MKKTVQARLDHRYGQAPGAGDRFGIGGFASGIADLGSNTKHLDGFGR